MSIPCRVLCVGTEHTYKCVNLQYKYLDLSWSYISVFTINKAGKQVRKLNNLTALGKRTKSNTNSVCRWSSASSSLLLRVLGAILLLGTESGILGHFHRML